ACPSTGARPLTIGCAACPAPIGPPSRPRPTYGRRAATFGARSESGRFNSAPSAKLRGSRNAAGGSPRLDADLPEHAARRWPEPAQVKPRAHLAVGARESVLVAQVGGRGEKVFQRRAVTGREHHRVERLGGAALEHGRGLGEAL